MIPVILSGGSGTRLWPVSRASYPKQFCGFYDESFLKNSVDRLQPFGTPYIVTVETMKNLTEKSLKEAVGCTDEEAKGFVIAEPMGKNTAPAVALICHVLEQQGKSNEVVGIFPADHLITEKEEFQRAVKLGVDCANENHVVTLGISPRYPSTGFGYIEVTNDQFNSANDLTAYKVKSFREKPDGGTAQSFVDAGNFYWNAGMFIFKVSVMIEHFKKHLPETWKKISTIDKDFSNAKYAYATTESISIDYGIMEKLDEQVCIPCTLGWSDVGSWDELSRLAEETPTLSSGSQAEVFHHDAARNYVFSVNPKVVGLIGVDHLIVVETPDALLISKKGESQKVKEVLNEIKQAGLPAATEHPFEHRPWGGFEILSDQDNYKAKKITVDPGGALSYQSHEKREEHWIIIEGEPVIVLDGKEHKMKPGQYFFIPKKSKHRIKNLGKNPVVFVEVQTGSYFGEDDIVRYEDNYNRAVESEARG